MCACCKKVARVVGQSADATDWKMDLLVGGLPRHESRASFSIKTNRLSVMGAA